MKKICAFLFAVFISCGFAFATTDIAADAESSECTENITGTYSGDANFKAKWAPNNIQLRWYDGYTGTQIIPANISANTCNYGGALTIPNNPPERIGYIFDGWKVSILPPGYIRLEYIESTGTQYIDTGIYWKSGYSLELDFTSGVATGNLALFGASNGSNYSDGEVSCFWYKGVFDRVVPSSNIVSYQTRFGSYLPNTRYNLVYNNTETIAKTENNIYSINNSGFYTDYIGNKTMYLFATNRDSNYKYFGAFKVHSLKMFDNDTLVRNFIPAKRNSDNEIGMYDTVSGTFFTNAGTGSFIAGPVAN